MIDKYQFSRIGQRYHVNANTWHLGVLTLKHILMKKTYATLNLVSIVSIIFWNYYVNAVGINGNTVGSLSDEYANLFTPASYAFSIWGLIFSGLLLHGLHQMKVAYSSEASEDTLMRMGPWLLVANIGNALWVWFWLHEMTLLSVVAMLVILYALLNLVVRLGIGKETTSKAIQRWTWAPIALYAGWISVATIANISAYLAKIEWAPLLSEMQWAATLMIVALIVNLVVLRTRQMAVFAAVGAWALFAIAVRHWGTQSALQWIGVGAAIILVFMICYQSFKLQKHKTTQGA